MVQYRSKALIANAYQQPNSSLMIPRSDVMKMRRNSIHNDGDGSLRVLSWIETTLVVPLVPSVQSGVSIAMERIYRSIAILLSSQ